MEKRNEGEMTMIRVPDYYERFRCLAGECPHSCCEAWDVVLDEETVERYRREEGALGENGGRGWGYVLCSAGRALPLSG